MRLFSKRDKQQEERLLLIQYKQIFGTEAGRAVLKDLMTRFHVMDTHDGSFIAEGQRSVVLHLIKTSTMSIEVFDELWKENLE